MARNWRDYERDLADGRKFEKFVRKLIGADVEDDSSPVRREVKHDRNCSRTARLYIETEERSVTDPSSTGSRWHPSGVMAGDGSVLFYIGDYSPGVWMFTVRALLAYYAGMSQEGWECKRCRFVDNKTNTARGFLLCFRHADDVMEKFIPTAPQLDIPSAALAGEIPTKARAVDPQKRMGEYPKAKPQPDCGCFPTE